MSFFSVFLLSLLVVLLGTFSIHFAEPETFPTLFDSLWWTMTTLTTVGYGDYSPGSVPGRVIGMILFIFGIGIFGALISKTVEHISTYNRLKEEGKIVYKKDGHYVYITWSKKTKEAIEEVLATQPDAKIVIIENSEKTPYRHDNVHFVQGDPAEEETLTKANVLGSKRVCIFSDSFIDDATLADGKTLLIASAVECLCTEGNDIHTIVEISKESHISKFKHVKVDDFIVSNGSVSRLMAKATLNPGTTAIFRQLLSKRFGSNIHEMVPKPGWKTYKDAHQELFENGAVLIAVNDSMNISMNQQMNLQNNDILYVICDDQVAASIGAY
ncbi:potassium channel protein [Bacillus sp. IB182487]|uniref:Potassium channel protein n=2 Tax=Metabacillus arenae TaxID=2771434 RepID=A0A926NIX1_9BACI|nr:potassium channel protein [Metabacillus arenae]